MTTSGTGIFFDGVTSARHDVTVELGADGAAHPRGRRRDAGRMALRPSSSRCRRPTACCGSAAPAARCWRGSKCATRRSPRRSTTCRYRSTAAAAPSGGARARSSSGASPRPSRSCWSPSFGVPALATQLAPLVPLSGRAPARRCRRHAGPHHARHQATPARRSSAAAADGEKAGRAAFDKLIGKLETAAALPIPLSAAVVRKADANAITLPGGHIYVFEGLIDKSRNARRARRRDRARDRPCRPSRRHALGAAGGRPVVPVRHAARRLRRRRRGHHRGARRCCSRAIRATWRRRPTPTAST